MFLILRSGIIPRNSYCAVWEKRDFEKTPYQNKKGQVDLGVTRGWNKKACPALSLCRSACVFYFELGGGTLIVLRRVVWDCYCQTAGKAHPPKVCTLTQSDTSGFGSNEGQKKMHAAQVWTHSPLEALRVGVKGEGFYFFLLLGAYFQIHLNTAYIIYVLGRIYLRPYIYL